MFLIAFPVSNKYSLWFRRRVQASKATQPGVQALMDRELIQHVRAADRTGGFSIVRLFQVTQVHGDEFHAAAKNTGESPQTILGHVHIHK